MQIGNTLTVNRLTTDAFHAKQARLTVNKGLAQSKGSCDRMI